MGMVERVVGAWLLTLVSGCVLDTAAPDEELGVVVEALANNVEQANPSGASTTFSSAGTVAQTGPFFDSLGANGRRCVDCHQPDQGWSITPSRLALSFARSGGTDPIFRPIDGATHPGADVSTLAAKRVAYQLLLGRGLIRVGLGIPAGAEFTLSAVDDPYGYASAEELSLFRRPLPAANLRFQATVMWDGRERPPTRSADDALLSQAEGATLGHAEALFPPTSAQKRAIVDFESALFSAQVRDTTAGLLAVQGATGGAQAIATQGFALGMNDPTKASFDPRVFRLFGAWLGLAGTGTQDQARLAIARGELLFNTKRLEIRSTPGINDSAEFGNQAVVVGTCGTCHNTPAAGTSSVARFVNIGVGGANRRTPDMPLYTLRNNATGETVQTTDPGRALITGKWKDIASFKVPSLRSLAARAPYFHNGDHVTLEQVVNLYNVRFRMNMTEGEQADMVAFLKAL